MVYLLLYFIILLYNIIMLPIYLFIFLINTVLFSMERKIIDYNDFFKKYKEKKIELLNQQITIINNADENIMNLLEKNNYPDIESVRKNYSEGTLFFNAHQKKFIQQFEHMYGENIKNIHSFKMLESVIYNFEKTYDDSTYVSGIKHNVYFLNHKINENENDMLYDLLNKNKPRVVPIDHTRFKLFSDDLKEH